MNKKFRAGQKTVDREVSHVQASITELERSLFHSPVPVDQICSLIGVTVEKLQTMKRKVCNIGSVEKWFPSIQFSLQIEEAINDELDAAQNCKRRVEHLKIGAVGPLPSGESSITYTLWKKTRVERFLVDHLLRSGHYSTGTQSKTEKCSSSIIAFI